MILYPFPPKNNYRKDLIKTITSFCFSHYMLFRYIKESISNAKKRAKPSTSVGESTKQSVDSSAKKISSNDLSEMNTLNAILDDEIATEYFHKYLASEYCEFQLEFWIMVRSLVRLIESEEEKQFPKEGRKEILNISVNIGDNLRRPLLKWNELALKIMDTEEVYEWEIEYTSRIFEDVAKMYQKAQYDVFKMLRGSYRRFKKNRLFNELQEALIRSNDEDPPKFISTRGSCARSNCVCELYVDNEMYPMSNCVACNHFYEEHVNLGINDSLESHRVTEDKKAGAVSSDQRRKLQLLLGKSFIDKDADLLQRNSRREFLIKNIAAIVNHPTEPLKMKSMRVYLKKYKNCFTARDLIKKLQKRLSLSKRETVNIASEMMELRLVCPVDKSQHVFMEGKFFYRFANDVMSQIESFESTVQLVDSDVADKTDSEDEPSTPSSIAAEVNMLDMLMAFHGPSEQDEKKEEKTGDKGKKEKKRKDGGKKDSKVVETETDNSKSKLSLTNDPFYHIYRLLFNFI